jgi:hypothetical protein
MGDIIPGVLKVLKVLADARVPRMRRTSKAPIAGAALAAVLLLTGCGREEEPAIRLHGEWLVVENQTKIEWRDVSVTVNAYYKGVAPRVAPGGRLEAPLAGFVTGFGQRFDTARERITRVEVRATDATGQPVALDWDVKTGKALSEPIEGR